MKKLIAALFGIAFLLTWVGVSNAQPKIVGKTTEYTVRGVTMKGYLAYDENIKGRRPGVLVVPEWWGVNEYSVSGRECWRSWVIPLWRRICTGMANRGWPPTRPGNYPPR